MPMYPKEMFFTSESVTEGHPDKCVIRFRCHARRMLRQDPESRVACNTYVTMGMMIVGGEITTMRVTSMPWSASWATRSDTHPKYGYDVNTGAILKRSIPSRPTSIKGVRERGKWAGDQGMMFGYACRRPPS